MRSLRVLIAVANFVTDKLEPIAAVGDVGKRGRLGNRLADNRPTGSNPKEIPVNRIGGNLRFSWIYKKFRTVVKIRALRNGEFAEGFADRGGTIFGGRTLWGGASEGAQDVAATLSANVVGIRSLTYVICYSLLHTSISNAGKRTSPNFKRTSR
jgi:hypothetical protein